MSQCALLWAVVLFALVNMSCFFASELYRRFRGYYTGCDYIMRSFKQAKPEPNIVLLGSSIMRTPFHLADKEHSYYVPEYNQYCRSRTLQNVLRSSGLDKSDVFDLAIDGSMVSDVFLVHKTFLSGANAPKWIVYGLAPRDLLDNLLSKETRTPLFDRLFDLKDIWMTKSLFNISLQEKLDLTLEKLFTIYGIRSDIQQSIVNVVRDISENGLSYRQTKPFVDTYTMRKEVSSKNIRIYRQRYKTFQSAKFEKQKLFLEALCKESTNNGTKILLVNMPLTQDIIKLIPVEAHNAYNHTLTETAKLPGVFLLDLQNSKEFPKDCFDDLVHLNGYGGHLLNMMISDTLLACSRQQNSFPRQDLAGKQTKKIFNLSNWNRERTITDNLASWWLAKAYFAAPQPPDVVILGSSQTDGLRGADAYSFDRLVDVTDNHRSYVIERDLKSFYESHSGC